MHQPVADCRGGAPGAIVSIVFMAPTRSSRTSARADDSWLEAAKRRLPVGEMGQGDEIADFPSRDRARADLSCAGKPNPQLVDILSTKRYCLMRVM